MKVTERVSYDHIRKQKQSHKSTLLLFAVKVKKLVLTN